MSQERSGDRRPDRLNSSRCRRRSVWRPRPRRGSVFRPGPSSPCNRCRPGTLPGS